MPKIFTREELIEIIKESQKCLKVVGTVIFDLPINDLKDFWFTKIDSGNYVLEFICESEPTLSYNALISSNRRISGESRSYEFGEFKTIQEAPLKKLKDYLEKRNCRHLEPEKDAVKYYLEELKINNIEEWKSEKEKIETGNFDYSNFKQCFYIRTCYIPFSVPFIQIDNRFFITYSLTKFCSASKFEEITENHIWYDEFKKYFNVFLENSLGAKKYSTEETKKGNKLEVIQMYNGLRQPLGLLPRDSFLEGTRVKVVIWGLIFTRDGKLLIHQRSKNAKDNQGMWDKSVGGHVDINDIDTVKAAAREMAEELFKNENEEQGGYGDVDFAITNVNKLIYLGEWNPDMRNNIPFLDVNNKKEEYYYFRMDYELSKKPIDSPRYLNDGRIQDVKVFVDLFVCIASVNFNIDSLKNSKYKLLELYELKDYYKDGFIEIDGEIVDFRITPDLKFILNNDELWEKELSSFVSYLKANVVK